MFFSKHRWNIASLSKKCDVLRDVLGLGPQCQKWLGPSILMPLWYNNVCHASIFVNKLLKQTHGFFSEHRLKIASSRIGKHRIVENIASLRKVNIAHPYPRAQQFNISMSKHKYWTPLYFYWWGRQKQYFLLPAQPFYRIAVMWWSVLQVYYYHCCCCCHQPCCRKIGLGGQKYIAAALVTLPHLDTMQYNAGTAHVLDMGRSRIGTATAEEQLCNNKTPLQ